MGTDWDLFEYCRARFVMEVSQLTNLTAVFINVAYLDSPSSHWIKVICGKSGVICYEFSYTHVY
jgi:hypothetical protein